MSQFAKEFSLFFAMFRNAGRHLAVCLKSSPVKSTHAVTNDIVKCTIICIYAVNPRCKSVFFQFPVVFVAQLLFVGYRPPPKSAKESMMQGLAVASGAVGAALPAVWSVVQPVADPFSDEKDTWLVGRQIGGYNMV